MPFTASIVQRDFVFIPDKILKLGGAAWIRKLPVSTQPWQRIRIGLLCAVTPDSTNSIYETLFTLGICSGATYPGASANTLNFLGASIIGAPTAGATRTLTYTASTNGPYYSTTAGNFFAKTEGSIYSQGAGFSPVAVLSTTPVSSIYVRRTLLVLDITRPVGGTGATAMTIYGPSSTLVQTTDYRPDDLQTALDQLGTPTIRGQAMTVLSSNSTVVTSPLVGDFDTMEIFWSNNNNPLEISAIGATVISPPILYTDSGIAIDSFESYGTTSGSIAESSFLTGGSGWSAPGSIAYDQSLGLSANTSNLAAQVQGAYLGTTCTPDEPFEQYATGTVNSNVTVSAGSFWGTNATVIVAASVPAPQVYTQYVGTTNQPDEPFEQYLTGTVNSGVTVNQGSYWGSAATSIVVVGLPAPQVYTQYVGTTLFPFDSFESYTVNNGSTTYGTTTSFAGSASLWGGTGTVYTSGSVAFAGTVDSNAYPVVYDTYGGTLNITLYGTALGLPYDTFEQYGTGAVTSGVTINAGTGWSANGYVNPYSLA